MAGTKKLNKSLRKATKLLVKELGGRKTVVKAVKKAARTARKDPAKAVSKLVKRLGGPAKVRRAVTTAAVVAAGAIAGAKAVEAIADQQAQAS